MTEVEKETMSFYHLMKQRQKRTQTVIKTILTEDGRTVNTLDDIRESVQNQFRTKFRKPSNQFNSASFFMNQIRKCIGDEENEFLNQDIKLEELEYVLHNSKKKKSPGRDGLTIEFYLQFWSIIKATILELFQFMFKNKQTCKTQKRGNIILIPKNKNPIQVKDYRPITLLNVDLKLYTRIFANRLRQIIHKCLHPSQSGVVPGKSVTADLIKVRELIKVAKEKRLECCLVSIDFASAFDKVRHEYLFEVMRRKGFSSDFIDVIKDLSTQVYSYIMVNNFATQPVEVERGIRQGCPLSVFLFSLSIDPLVCELHNILHGVFVNQEHLAVTSYVDDLSVVVISEKESNLINTVLRQYEQSSASEVNQNKSKALPLGIWRRTDLLFPYVEKLKILGITFTNDTRTLVKENMQSLVQGVKIACVQNKFRILCLEQRIFFIKTYVLSRIWYTAQVLSIPDTYTRQIQSAVLYFIWTGSIFRVPFPVLTLPKDKGGLNMTDIKLKCQVLYKVKNGLTTNSVKGEYQKQLDEKATPTIRVISQNPNILWNNIWKNILSPQLPAKVRSTWYTVVHDIIPCNERLAKIHLVATDKCKRCLTQVDSIQHRLTQCVISKQIWRTLAVQLAYLLPRQTSIIVPSLLLYPQHHVSDKHLRKKVNTLLGYTVHFIITENGNAEDYTIFAKTWSI